MTMSPSCHASLRSSVVTGDSIVISSRDAILEGWCRTFQFVGGDQLAFELLRRYFSINSVSFELKRCKATCRIQETNNYGQREEKI